MIDNDRLPSQQRSNDSPGGFWLKSWLELAGDGGVELLENLKADQPRVLAPQVVEPGLRPDLLLGYSGIELVGQDVGINENSRGHRLPRGRAVALRWVPEAVALWRRTAAEPPHRLLQSACAPAASRRPNGTRSFHA